MFSVKLFGLRSIHRAYACAASAINAKRSVDMILTVITYRNSTDGTFSLAGTASDALILVYFVSHQITSCIMLFAPGEAREQPRAKAKPAQGGGITRFIENGFARHLTHIPHQSHLITSFSSAVRLSYHIFSQK